MFYYLYFARLRFKVNIQGIHNMLIFADYHIQILIVLFMKLKGQRIYANNKMPQKEDQHILYTIKQQMALYCNIDYLLIHPQIR